MSNIIDACNLSLLGNLGLIVVFLLESKGLNGGLRRSKLAKTLQKNKLFKIQKCNYGFTHGWLGWLLRMVVLFRTI